MIQSFREWLLEQDLSEETDLKTLHYNLINDGGSSLSYIGSLHYDKSHDFFAFYLPKSKFEYFAKFGISSKLDGYKSAGWFIYKLKDNKLIDANKSIWRVRLDDFTNKFKNQSDAKKFMDKVVKAITHKNFDDAYDIIQDIFDKS